jgi:hypothetical protein
MAVVAAEAVQQQQQQRRRHWWLGCSSYGYGLHCDVTSSSSNSIAASSWQQL